MYYRGQCGAGLVCCLRPPYIPIQILSQPRPRAQPLYTDWAQEDTGGQHQGGGYFWPN